jgi:hypothetical protein
MYPWSAYGAKRPFQRSPLLLGIDLAIPPSGRCGMVAPTDTMSLTAPTRISGTRHVGNVALGTICSQPVIRVELIDGRILQHPIQAIVRKPSEYREEAQARDRAEPTRPQHQPWSATGRGRVESLQLHGRIHRHGPSRPNSRFKIWG